GYAFFVTVVAAAMTAFYSWRQFLMTFHGRFRGADEVALSHADADAHAHDEPTSDESHGHGHAIQLSEVHESPLTMLVPLGVLAVGALLAGVLFDASFIGPDSKGFWHGAIAAIAGFGLNPQVENFPAWVEAAPMIVTIIGFGIAYYYYVLHPDLPAKMAARGG